MSLLLRRKLSSPFLNSIPNPNAFNCLLLRFSSASPPPKPTSMAEYLVQSCGFSLDKASRASKHISHVTSFSKPESVRHFLKHHNFTDRQIRTIISNYPYILCAEVDSIEPNLCALRGIGFDEADLRRLVTLNPQSLQLRSAISRLEYWKSFLDGDMKKLLLAFRRNRCLVNLDTDKGVAPKIALLERYGISHTGIVTLVVRGNSFIKHTVPRMELVLKRVEELGYVRGSPGFLLGVSSFSGLGSDTLKSKMEMYKSFGWSEEELLSALRKFPNMIRLSEDNIRAKIAFLVERAGCTHRYIALRPQILRCSLEKRLIPRHYAMKISNKLARKKLALLSVMALSEQKLLEKIVLPYKDKLPTLLEDYINVRDGKVLLDNGSTGRRCTHDKVQSKISSSLYHDLQNCHLLV